MNTKKYGVKANVWDEIIELAKENNVEKVILFGSRARGDYKERSDIDLAIQGGNTVCFSIEIEEKVQTLLMFDVIDLLAPLEYELKESIEKEGIIVYEKA
ncbi:MAG: nucleotidyltransferase domain-containing protein [Eubacteriales bacterium]